MLTIPSSSSMKKNVKWYFGIPTLVTFRDFTQPNQALLSPPQPQNINLIVPILPPNSTPAPEVRPPAPDYPDYDTDYSRPDYNDYNYNSGNEPSPPPPPVSSNDYSNDYNYEYYDNSIDQGKFKFEPRILMEFSLEF